MKVGLQHHSEEGLVDAAAAFQQGWKYDPFRSLGIVKFRSPAAVVNVLGRGEPVARLATSPNEP